MPAMGKCGGKTQGDTAEIAASWLGHEGSQEALSNLYHMRTEYDSFGSSAYLNQQKHK